MLNCPFCQFENPDSQRFCDQCGEYLQRWVVIRIPPQPAGAIAAAAPYLDAAKRYRRLDGLGVMPGGDSTIELVLDCNPKAGSPLEDLQAAWLEEPGLEFSQLKVGPPVPVAALPYLALQADYFPTVPELHNAWDVAGHAILLMDDRTDWLSFLEAWSTQVNNPWQQVQWLFEMTLLWPALEAWQAQSSLLKPAYLKLDANRLLCLTHLVPDPDPQPLPLQRLGQFWQRSLPLDVDSFPDLGQLIQAVAMGTLTEVVALQEQLAIAADTYSPMGTSPENANDVAMAGDLPSFVPEWEDHPEMSYLDDSELMELDLPEEMTLATDSPTEADDGLGLQDAATTVLPMKLAQVDDIGQSHVGRQRNHNEDWFLTQTSLTKTSGPRDVSLRAKGLYILCDGMGGHAAGEVASQLAVETLRDYFADRWSDTLPDKAALTTGVIAANQAIFDINQAKASSGVGRMGTTLVMVLLHDLSLAVAHVGDSRLYSYSKRLGLQQLTVDHEVGQREIYRGIEPAIAYARPDAYQLTQALGPRDQSHLSPTISYHEVSEDTLLILCSDGLSDNDLLERYTDTHIAPLLSSRASLEGGAAQLIDLANEHNGHDNITVVLTRIKLRPDMVFLG